MKVETVVDWKEFVKELKRQWTLLWRTRINDRVRAEGIASQDYPLLFVDRGDVILATRNYKPPDFIEILERYKPPDKERLIPPDPSVGGWGKFIRTVIRKQRASTSRRDFTASRRRAGGGQQLKKGGRGWLHLRLSH